MNDALDLLLQTRKNFIELVDGLSIEELNAVPTGFSNNIIWNFAHTLAAQQLLCYKLSGLPMHLEAGFVDAYKKGSKPQGKVSEVEIKKYKEEALFLINRISSDLEAGIFKTYTPYTTSYGTTISNIEQAIKFVNIHEGLHLGYAMALRKAVKTIPDR